MAHYWTVEEELAALECETYAEFEKLYPDITNNGYRFKRKRLLTMNEDEFPESGVIVHDDEPEPVHWREIAEAAKTMQALGKRMSGSKDTAKIEVNADDGDPFILFLSDLHIGDWATDYDLLMRITDEIVETPRLYVGLLGDILNMAIKLRGVAEVTGGNQLTPSQQAYFLDTWLSDIAHKVVFATWDNHAVEREENGTGISAVRSIQAKRTTYFGGIGHPDIIVGDQLYEFAVSHRFRGSSIDNPCHAPMRYLRREGPARELAAMGDYHVPGIIKFNHGGRDKVAVNCGSTQTNSPYAKRHYSLFTQDSMPGVVLRSDEHCITPYYNVGEWKHSQR